MSTKEDVKVGDRVARVTNDGYNGSQGVVVDIAEVVKRTGAPRLRVRVRWDRGGRTWLALDLKGKTWRRVAKEATE